MTMGDYFHRFAQRVSSGVGSGTAFVLAFLVVLAWALTGPLFHYSNTWQLVINTGTTIVTFLMVFLIQNTQNRDAKVFQLKLDELIRAVRDARNDFIDIESLSDKELEQIQAQFRDLREHVGPSRLNRSLVDRLPRELARREHTKASGKTEGGT